MIIIIILLILLRLLVIMVEMTTAVEVIMSIYASFVKISSSEVDLGRQSQILGVAFIQSIDKILIFGLGNSTN